MPNKPDIIGLPRSSGKAFAVFDRELAKAAGPRWLEDTRVAQCVEDTLHFAEGELKLYKLLAWVIMPNHVHILVDPAATLPQIAKAVKNFSARKANEILDRFNEPFWQEEYYDHWARNADEVERIARYIEFNPGAVGFVDRPEDWRWSSAWAGRDARPTARSITK